MWTDEEMKVVLEIKKQCLFGLFLHARSAYINHIINNSLVFPNIILGGVLSVSLFTTSDGIWKLAGGAIALVSTIITGITKHVGAAEKSQLHCLVVREYQRLLHDINIYIHKPVESTSATIELLRKEMDKIINMQPDPSMWVMQRFNSVYRAKFERMMLQEFEKAMLQTANTINNRVSNQRFKHSSNADIHHLYENSCNDIAESMTRQRV